MPYFVKVGYEKKNVYKLTSQGYFIRRSDKHVITRWGAIDVKGMHKIIFSWKGTKLPMEKIHKFRGVDKAKEFNERKIKHLLKNGFNKLPSSAKIYKR